MSNIDGKLIKALGKQYFFEILCFCVMGNHFHLLIRMFPDHHFSDDDLRKRYQAVFPGRELYDGQIPHIRNKWSDLSEFMKDLKQRFSCFYNRRHHRRGFFWGDRYKSVIVENGETLINCLAYIDLNPLRAGLVKRPEEYRWCSLVYHIQTGNKDGFLSLDFGLVEFGEKKADERLRHYRRYLYEAGGLAKPGKKGMIRRDIVEQERERDFKLARMQRFLYRTRYFTDAGVIGSKEFVGVHYQRFKNVFISKKEKKPMLIKGLAFYSLKRFSEC